MADEKTPRPKIELGGKEERPEAPAPDDGSYTVGEAVRDGDYLVMNCIICGHSESTYSPLPPENPAPVDPPPVESPQPETPVVPSPEQPEASSVPTQEPTPTENTSGIASSSSETTTE